MRLREWVLDGTLSAGSRLNEVELSRTLGVSRGPIREAVQELIQEGLLKALPYRGVYVWQIDERNLREIYEMRMAIESYAVRLVAIAPTSEQLTQLAESVTVASDSESRESRYVEGDREDFHQLVLEYSGNARLIQEGRALANLLRVARLTSAERPMRRKQAQAEHQEVFEAIEGRDPLLAQELMIGHGTRAMRGAIDAMARSQFSERAEG